MAKSLRRSLRQRPASEGWCGTPPCSVSLGAVPAGGEEDEALELAAAVRARFFSAALPIAVGASCVNASMFGVIDLWLQ